MYCYCLFQIQGRSVGVMVENTKVIGRKASKMGMVSEKARKSYCLNYSIY